MFNLLFDPLLRVMVGETRREAALPEVFALAMRHEIDAFCALRPHQRHAWHAFLAQLGALAMIRTQKTEAPAKAEDWAAMLRALTPDHPDDAPWRLVVDDVTKPAFLQPPAPKGAALTDYPKSIATPDALDVLIASKNHDLKSGVMTAARPDDWIFALVSLQTMEGFLGAGNYGIARMNGGFSARPCLGLAPAEGGFGAHLQRDMLRLIDHRAKLSTSRYPYPNPPALLWLLEWDGEKSLTLNRLDALFIEVCRRVRLVAEGGGLAARAVSTKAARIAAKEAAGLTGDFWTPVVIDDGKEGKAFSLTEAGFDYRRLHGLLFNKNDYKKSPALSLSRSEKNAGQNWILVARGLARGQGKTEGYHERRIPFKPTMAAALGGDEEGETLSKLSTTQLEEAKQAIAALRFGCAAAASGGKEGGPSKDDRAYADLWSPALDRWIDERFFSVLQDRFTEKAGAREDFVKTLYDAGAEILESAIAAAPCPAVRRFKAGWAARRAYRFGFLKKDGPFADDRPLVSRSEDVADDEEENAHELA